MSWKLYVFKSGVQDRATGFVKFGQRWYNPTTGTWTQQDTLDAPLDPANANRYAYAGDDPINNTDPRGLHDLNGALEVAFAAAIGRALTGCVSGALASIVTLEVTAPAACLAGAIDGAGLGAIGGEVRARSLRILVALGVLLATAGLVISLLGKAWPAAVFCAAVIVGFIVLGTMTGRKK